MKPYLGIKRTLDIIFSLLLLITLSPIMLLIAILIKLDTRGPIIFKQNRLGKGGIIFEFYKFRSMVVNAESMGSGMYSFEGDPRVTKIGKLIRKTSLDELPQLINILKGEMSFIGPRPVLVDHPWTYKEYKGKQKKRFEVLPGLTGLAQVNGRKQLSWNERIKFDVAYVNHISFHLDFKILLKTFYVVLFNKNNVNTIVTNERKRERDQ
jgi:lipopolysaccharide/colanic/teichoic acid biosynthesis glycosyltransferase